MKTGAMKPFRPPETRATKAIVIVCALVELAVLFLGAGFDRTLAMTAGLVPARLSGDVIGLAGALPAPLTLVTHIFLHGGLIHLVMNMVFLAWVGRSIEWVVGPWRLLLLFLAGGIAGGIAQVLADPGSTIPVVGASGAVSAVFATYALIFARSDEAPATILGIHLSGEVVRALRYAALWIGLQFLVAVAFNLPGSSSGGGGGIAIWAHIGGFVAGLLFGLPWILRRVPEGR
jgi:membrane associated rhomboid family serine protease